MNQGSRLRLILVGIVGLLSLNMIPVTASASSLQSDPISLSFPSPHVGYLLSLDDCSANTCASLRSTNDAGTSWNVVPTPSQLNKHLRIVSWGSYGTAYAMLSVHFADAHDGWIYGTVPAHSSNPSDPNWVSRLWSTHNGGKRWQQLRLGPLHLTGGVVQMATHGKWTYLFGGEDTSAQSFIFATQSNVDQWTLKSKGQMAVPAGGTPLEGSFSFSGSSGWFVAGNDRGITASSRLSKDGTWIAWKGPAVDDASFTPIAAVSRDVLLVDGETAGFAYPPASSVPRGWNNGASWLFISHNAGATFTPLRQLSRSYQGSYSTVPGLPATPVPGTVLLQRAVKSGYELVRSTNWGRTWQVVVARSISQAVFTNHSAGFAIVQQRTNQLGSSLLRTNDAGEHWSNVAL